MFMFVLVSGNWSGEKWVKNMQLRLCSAWLSLGVKLLFVFLLVKLLLAAHQDLTLYIAWRCLKSSFCGGGWVGGAGPENALRRQQLPVSTSPLTC